MVLLSRGPCLVFNRLERGPRQRRPMVASRIENIPLSGVIGHSAPIDSQQARLYLCYDARRPICHCRAAEKGLSGPQRSDCPNPCCPAHLHALLQFLGPSIETMHHTQPGLSHTVQCTTHRIIRCAVARLRTRLGLREPGRPRRACPTPLEVCYIPIPLSEKSHA